MDPGIDNAPEQSGGEEAAIESILGKLDDLDEDGGAAAGNAESEGDEAQDEAGPSDEAKDGEDDARDQSETDTEDNPPAIEPPPGLTDDERKAWSSLPREAQEIIARRERDRTLELRRGQDEIANQRKAIEQERQRLAQTLETYIQLAQQLDPIIAEGNRTDWVKLSQENPAEAQTKWFAYQQRLAQLNAAVQEREAYQRQQLQERIAKEEALLIEKVPEWRDPEKGRAAMKELREAAVRYYGFAPEEVQLIPDHRQALVLRDALAYRKMLAAKKRVEAKKVAPVTKVQKPGAAGESPSPSERVKAMKQRAAKIDNLHEKAELIAAALD